MDRAFPSGDMWLNSSTAPTLLKGLETAATTVLLMPSVMLDHMWLE